MKKFLLNIFSGLLLMLLLNQCTEPEIINQ